MTKLVAFLVVAIVGLAAITAAGPTLVALTRAAVPLVVAIGFAVLVLRIVWYITNRW